MSSGSSVLTEGLHNAPAVSAVERLLITELIIESSESHTFWVEYKIQVYTASLLYIPEQQLEQHTNVG